MRKIAHIDTKDLGEPSAIFLGGTEQAEAAKLRGSRIAPKLCPRNCAAQKEKCTASVHAVNAKAKRRHSGEGRKTLTTERPAEPCNGAIILGMSDAGQARQVPDADFLQGGGELGERIRLHDWSATPVGPISGWPQPMRAAVSLCVKSQFPIIIHWGWPDLVVLYNDAFIPLVGDKHPAALGTRLFDSWPELRPTIENMLVRVFSTGHAALSKDLLHVYRRNGYLEERYLTASFNPVVLDSGQIKGSFTLIDDTTDRVIGERRLRILRDLAASSMKAKEIDEACRLAAEVLGCNRYDVPFALFYLLEQDHLRMVAAVGLNPGEPASPSTIDLTAGSPAAPWPLAQAVETNSVQEIHSLQEKFGSLPGGAWNESPDCALVVPITLAGQHVPTALLVAGISPRKQPDGAYREFLDSVSKLLAATFMCVRAHQSLAIREIVDLIPVLIDVMKPDNTVLYANKAILDYTGFSIEEARQPDTTNRFFHPDDIDRLREERRKAMLGNKPFEIEERIRRKDGQYRWFLCHFNPLLDDQDRVIRWYATGTDIDDRVRAEEKMRNENLVLREQIERDSMYEDIVGSSEPLSKVLSQISKVAPSDSTVLILGETGTGKELIARAIHKRSSRASRPFIAVNCAAIPLSLIASELFGHEKGAFTGATQRRLGRFEAANGGTIFLDEVGDLPQEIQIALLRVLQEREIERVGGDGAIPVDVRVVAATHRDLHALVSEGKFRQDLLYRLNVVPIQMPSLRERAADIPLLLEYFIARFGSKAGKKFRTIDKRTLKLLQAYEWPGNVRELQNVIERAVILSDSETFAVDETWLKRELSEVPRATAAFSGVLLKQEKEMIETALAESRGRVSGLAGAAAKLGLPTRTLDSKIKRLGIDKYRFKSQTG
jgi:formate hydrogenlyase transcriptional activator